MRDIATGGTPDTKTDDDDDNDDVDDDDGDNDDDDDGDNDDDNDDKNECEILPRVAPPDTATERWVSSPPTR